jgi:hypothetical protein
MKSEISLELLQWDKPKNSAKQDKWNLAPPMMYQAGSKNFNKTKTKANEPMNEPYDILHSFFTYFLSLLFLSLFLLSWSESIQKLLKNSNYTWIMTNKGQIELFDDFMQI